MFSLHRSFAIPMVLRCPSGPSLFLWSFRCSSGPSLSLLVLRCLFWSFAVPLVLRCSSLSIWSFAVIRCPYGPSQSFAIQEMSDGIVVFLCYALSFYKEMKAIIVNDINYGKTAFLQPIARDDF